MNKIIVSIIITIIIIALVIGGVFFIVDLQKVKKSDKPIQENTKINIVLSLEDKIEDNTAWCGTFNLIWNDLKNDLAKQDIVFTPQLKVVENLNRGTFTSNNLSESSYYKVYGHPSLKLKKEIEDAIKKKFNETSDILDDFEWEERDAKDYFLYTMLKKEFEFPKEFTELANEKFGDNEDIKYFGINGDTDSQVRNQVQILYYNSKEDFAVKLLTKSNDEVILTRGNNKDSFGAVYEDIMKQKENYKGNSRFNEEDILKIPNIKIDLKKEFEELQKKEFLFSNGDVYTIEKAIQTIKFDLNKKGGKVKSEAGMMVKFESAIEIKERREFVLNDTFMIFLVEKGKDLPYFAAKISDITNE